MYYILYSDDKVSCRKEHHREEKIHSQNCMEKNPSPSGPMLFKPVVFVVRGTTVYLCSRRPPCETSPAPTHARKWVLHIRRSRCYRVPEIFIITDVTVTYGENRNAICELGAIIAGKTNEKKMRLCFPRWSLTVTAGVMTSCTTDTVSGETGHSGTLAVIKAA